MAEDEISDEDRALVGSKISGAATNHLMSFVHTPAVFSLSDLEELPEITVRGEDLGKEIHHDLRTTDDRFKRATTTEYEDRRLIHKAQELRGQVVTPTSSTMTIAYYLKAYHSSRQRLRRADLRAPLWYELTLGADEKRDGLSPESKWAFGAPGTVYGKAQIAKNKKFGNENYKLANHKKIRDSSAQSVWIPNLLKSPSWPKHVKSNKKLSDRLNAIAKHLKPIEGKNKVDNKNLNRPNRLTPLTEYYLMRYLSPWLIDQNWVDQAMPKLDESTNKVVIQSIDIGRSVSNNEIDNSITEMIVGLVQESETPIDELFAFERIRTTYEYPRNYPNDHTDNDGNILQPDPKTGNIEITYGILQKMYAVQSPSERKNMIEQTKKWVLDQANKKKIKHATTGEQYGPTLGRGNRETWLPVGRGLDLSTAEATLVWLEETDDERKFQSEYTLKLPTDLNKLKDKEQISEGATITVPGIILLMAEIPNNHALYDAVAEANTMHTYPEYGGFGMGGALDERTGLDYIISLSETTQKPGMIQDMDSEETVEVQEEAFRQIIADQYDGIFIPVNEKTARFVITDEEGVFTTLHLNPKELTKTHTASDLIDRFNMDRYEHLKWTLGDELNNVGWNTTVRTDDGDEMAVSAYANDTGITLRKARRFAAKAFNALGYLVEEQMIVSAQQAVRTMRGMPTSSDFDKMIAALIGTPKNPGLATSHATMHYQYLYMQMKSPVKNWEIVEKQEFEQGTMLALESYLDQPALKAIYWMLNEKGFINIGNFEGTRPQFFKMPSPAQYSEAKYTGMQNAFATVVIGYYRLMFAQIRQRLVAHKIGQEGAKAGAETVNISKYWKELLKDAASSPPDPAMFGLVLRFFTKSPSGQKSVLQIPTWMPVMPENMREAKNTKINRKEPLNYLKWAYGTDPISLESFSEIAAAYHAAKALSYHDDYPHMIERFVNAVIEDKGAAFLFAILNSENTPDLTAEPIMGVPTTITNVNFMDGVTAVENETPDPAPPPVIIQGEYNPDAFKAAIKDAMRPRDWTELDKDAAIKARNQFMHDQQRKAAEALLNLDKSAIEANRNAVFNLLRVHSEMNDEPEISQRIQANIAALKAQIEEGVITDEDAANVMLEEPGLYSERPDEEERMHA